MIKIIFWVISFLFLVYLLLPGPTKVEQFGQLPNSIKSTEPGDTIQLPNIAAYFSNYWRKGVVPFYRQSFADNFKYLNISLPYIILNHPPERGAEVIKPYIQSWYLEEYIHPLRESLYVNGWEPYDEMGRRRNKYANGIIVDNIVFNSKTTLRYYTSPLWSRVAIWFGITGVVILLYKVSKKIIKETYA